MSIGNWELGDWELGDWELGDWEIGRLVDYEARLQDIGSARHR
jgi:hypothetical protein